MNKLSHVDSNGQVNMVDVSGKSVTTREAVAEAILVMHPSTLDLVISGRHHKGDVFAVCRVAGIQGAKATSTLIPLCHPLPLTKVSIEITTELPNMVRVLATCKTHAVTGVEMEALTGASVAALTFYDMCKAVDPAISIERVCLLKKTGGKLGDYERPND